MTDDEFLEFRRAAAVMALSALIASNPGGTPAVLARQAWALADALAAAEPKSGGGR